MSDTDVLTGGGESSETRDYGDSSVETRRSTGCCDPRSSLHRFIVLLFMCFLGFGMCTILVIIIVVYKIEYQCILCRFIFLLRQSWSFTRQFYERYGHYDCSVFLSLLFLFMA